MAHLGQLPEVGSLPTKLVQDAAVEALLLRAAAAQLGDVGVVQTGPVLRERLGTVALYLPATHTHTHTHTDTHTHGHTHTHTHNVKRVECKLSAFQLDQSQRKAVISVPELWRESEFPFDLLER